MKAWARNPTEEALGRRLAAAIVDLMGFVILVSSFFEIVGEIVEAEALGYPYTISGLVFFGPLVIAVAYYVVPEALTGKTLGKWLFGLRVEAMNGRHGFVGAFVRGGFLLVDIGLLGVLLILFTPNHQRIGDLLAGTVVVRNSASRNSAS